MPNNISNIGFGAQDPEMAEIERQRRMAMALQQQGQTPLGPTEMAGGWAVQRSPFEGIGKIAQSLAGAYGANQADRQTKELTEDRASRRSNDIAKALAAGQARPAMPEIAAPLDELGGGPGAPAQAATAGDPMAAYSMLAQSRDPALQQAGLAGSMAMLKPIAPYSLRPNETRYGPDNKPIVTAPAPAAPAAPFTLAPGQTRYGADGKPIVAVPEKVDYNKPFMPNGQPNPAYQEFALRNSRAGGTNVSVNTDKSYFGNVAEGLAKQDVAAIDAARSAPQRIESARMVRQFLDKNPITGSFAESRLAFEKGLATAGLIDGERVKNTESLASNLASQTLDAIKTSGLGSGQGFTDKDRAFLERAKSGNIEINAGTLRQLAELNEKSARASLTRGNELIRKLKGNKQMGQVGVGLDEIPEPGAGQGGGGKLNKNADGSYTYTP